MLIKATYQLETLSCPSCLQKIEAVLKNTAGVKDFKVLFNASKVKLTFDSTVVQSETIEKAIGDLGYPVIKVKLK